MSQDKLGTFSAHKGYMNLEYLSACVVQNLHLPFLSVLKHSEILFDIIQFEARMIGNPNIDNRGHETANPKLACWYHMLWPVWSRHQRDRQCQPG